MSSFASSLASSSRLAPTRPLSITVPDAQHYIPPSAGARPPSSLSNAWTDRTEGSVDSDSERGADRLDSWEDVDEGRAAAQEIESLLQSSSQGVRRYDLFDQLGEAEDLDNPPLTPVTLPPASLASSLDRAGSAAFSHPIDTVSPRSPFPSSDEGVFIGLGVGEAALSHQEAQHRLRLLEDMRDRAVEGRQLGRSGAIAEVNEEGDGGDSDRWKEEAFLADVAAAATVAGASDSSVGGSGHPVDLDGIPFPLSDDSPSIDSISDQSSPLERLERDLPLRPPSGSPQVANSTRPSTASTDTSSNSSTLSLPPVPIVDLNLPNHNRAVGTGTFMSVANGPMALLASDSSGSSGLVRSQSTRGPRSFLTNLLGRSPRSPNPSATFPSAPTSPFVPRSPSAPEGFQNPALGNPSLASVQRQASHSRSSSLPSPEARSFRSSFDRLPPGPNSARDSGASPRPQSSPSLREAPSAASRASSIRPPSSPLASSPSLPGTAFSSLLNGRSNSQSNRKPTSSSSSPQPPPPTLGSIGLSLVPLTQPLSTSRNSQPLCGALLDDKYILIGTTGGLDFLPIPLPGSLPMRTHGKKRRETRKPIPLIKRTRFKELAVLSERSNILLAIAGRNDHIRVYALDGIRAMIEKKMSELDLRDGYPMILDPVMMKEEALDASKPDQDEKGKTRVEVPPANPTTTPRLGQSGSTLPRSPSPAPQEPIQPRASFVPRAATLPRLSKNERSPTLDLAEMIRSTGPEDGPAIPTPRRPSNPPPPQTYKRSRRPSQESPKISASSQVRSPSPVRPGSMHSRSPLVPGAATMPRPVNGERSPTLDLAEMIRSTGPEDPSPTPSRYPSPPPRLPSSPLPPHDFKRPPSTLPQDAPTLPASSQVPPEAHPANSNSPLEYVKLARTKGARLLRAVETKKRTYLAVLCGDEGERIELFTGSRSISLSLNRTFVLPENPRTIEFQIQGDDLIDIYLVYPESIFALEPATVRVREVGVGRGERRARRDRERRLRDIATENTAEPGAAPLEPPLSATLHPADPALAEQPAVEDENAAELDGMLPRGLELGSASSNPSRSPSPQPPGTQSNENERPLPTPRRSTSEAAPRVARTSTGPDTPPVVPPRAKTVLPYSTFQQLPFVPPVPSSVLASAWIIPPLYTDVTSSVDDVPDYQSEYRPSITVTGDRGGKEDEPPAHEDYPLLSPISLLGGAAHRANGPPGLFFVCRSRNLSGIVTGDGRSVIKKPLVWSLDKPADGDAGTDVIRRIEMLIVGGTKTVILGIGNTEVKAIAVGGGHGEAPFSAAVSLTPTTTSKSTEPRDIVFLGTHAPSNQMFFTERVGQASWRAWCVGTRY
ncbi:hypothetical protein P7C70_g6487, partial [Phenoliferia sp. Uapishka_3]